MEIITAILKLVLTVLSIFLVWLQIRAYRRRKR